MLKGIICFFGIIGSLEGHALSLLDALKIATKDAATAGTRSFAPVIWNALPMIGAAALTSVFTPYGSMACDTWGDNFCNANTSDPNTSPVRESSMEEEA